MRKIDKDAEMLLVKSMTKKRLRELRNAQRAEWTGIRTVTHELVKNKQKTRQAEKTRLKYWDET